MSRLRFAPDLPFPAYAFVPGKFPHPVSDPAGHSFGKREAAHTAFDPLQWRELTLYLHGIDLFNHGYYWESHEAFESLWHALGGKGPTADLLKGLIRLAACAVKMREGRADGVQSHSHGAAALFRRAGGRHLGLDAEDMARLAESVTFVPGPEKEPAVRVVFDFVLRPT